MGPRRRAAGSAPWWRVRARFDVNLKLGTDYNPPRPEVKFAYPQDDGDFAHAALRCVGVG